MYNSSNEFPITLFVFQQRTRYDYRQQKRSLYEIAYQMSAFAAAKLDLFMN